MAPSRAGPPLRPVVRAYFLGYVSTAAPRLLTVLLRHLKKRKTQDSSQESLLAAIEHILRSSLAWNRFPAFCAALVGGSTWLQIPFRRLLARCAPNLSSLARVRLARCLASFIAAYASLQLLQSKEDRKKNGEGRQDGQDDKDGPGGQDGKAKDKDDQDKQSPLAGRTLDLTLFAATRAMDVLAGALWSRRRARREAAGRWTRAESLVGQATDPALFALSSALVMWTWIYEPWRLPRSYDRWIAAAAAVDGRLIEALRRCRKGILQYGCENSPDGRLLEGMCADYGWPAAWGNPAVSIPFPCDMVHMGCGPSCEWHGLVRLARSWRWAMTTYLPVSLALALRTPPKSSSRKTTTPLARRLLLSVLSAARSSAFLAAFVSLFFYGVCLMRTRLGPRLLGHAVAARQAFDGGLCTAAGCALCGWSVLLERASRRKDLALFVAPRALATLLPRRYPRPLLWRETLLFATSTAVVFTAVQEDPRRVRGVLGNILNMVLRD